MLVTTTSLVEGHSVKRYFGIVAGEAIMGANIFKDVFAGIRDIVGGRSAAYEEVLRQAKAIATDEMIQQARDYGANAILGVDLDYETVGDRGAMLMVVATGTAVLVEGEPGCARLAARNPARGGEVWFPNSLGVYFARLGAAGKVGPKIARQASKPSAIVNLWPLIPGWFFLRHSSKHC